MRSSDPSGPPNAGPQAAEPGPPPALPANVWLVGQAGHETQRAGRYSRDSVRGHPGKMLPDLARRLVEEYTRPGDWILDPMSGIGTTGVEAIRLDRHYLGLELEERFVRFQQENLERAREGGAPGRFAVLRQDARALAALFFPELRMPGLPPRMDAVITSPPYADRLGVPWSPSRVMRELIREGRFSPTALPDRYGEGRDNLGNLAPAAYARAMAPVYAGCFAALRPGGLLVLVLQPQRHGARLHPLHHEAAQAAAAAGFVLLDEVAAVVGRVAVAEEGGIRFVSHASFWRRLHAARLRRAGFPVTLGQIEYVLVFRKPGGTAKAAAGPPLPVRPAARKTIHAGEVSRRRRTSPHLTPNGGRGRIPSHP